MRSVVRFAVCVVLCYGVAALGGAATYPSIPTWYAGLVKPAWTPPNAVFPVVWTTLYGMMTVSLWLLWDRSIESPQRTRAIMLFLVQLALNALWSPVFFALHWVWTAFVIVLAMIVAVALTIRAAVPVNRIAGLLLLPYLAWICYASTLNAGVAVLNPR